MIDKVRWFVTNYFSKQILIYVSYHITIAICYLIIISIIAFFHFLLGHRLSQIQEWILGYGWQLVIMSKLIAIYIIFHFIEMDNIKGDIYKKIINIKKRMPERNVLIVTLFTAVFFILAGKPEAITYHQFQIIRFVLAIIGMLVFYLTDLFLISAMQYLYPLNRHGLKLRLLIFPLIFWGMSKLTFMYTDGINELVWVLFFGALYLLNMNMNNQSNILYFISLISGVFVFCGSDPVWGELFSTIHFGKPLTIIHISSWLIIFMTYLWIKKSKFIIKAKRRFSNLFVF